ncbi:MAG: beta-lactamase family protein, partial [Planctomycetaceae bacterium]|nr:beta-lactamase family protein [Planctomycetaceae bacterium]
MKSAFPVSGRIRNRWSGFKVQSADCCPLFGRLVVAMLILLLVSVPAKADETFASFDWRIGDFLKEHKVPGVSIAVTNRGRVVFAKGYGVSDVATEEPVRLESLFRIASISKPITAVAILQLIEQKKLDLDDKVFAVLDDKVDIKSAGDKFETRLR